MNLRAVVISVIVFLCFVRLVTEIFVMNVITETVIAITQTRQQNIPNSDSETLEQIARLIENDAKLEALDAQWQVVEPPQHLRLVKFFVYSAYMDSRKGKKTIRIIGATKTITSFPVKCLFYYKNSNKTETIDIARASVSTISENWSLKYSAVFILCDAAPGIIEPYAVSILYEKSSIPTNKIKILNKLPRRHIPLKNKDKIAVCVKPIHFRYNKVLNIIEFIEMNRILGVDHFVFYNSSIGDSVNCVLDDYKKRGIVTVLPWKLNLISQKEIRTEGIFAALNDCLYRNMYSYTYVAFIDFDEIIFPKFGYTLIDLLRVLEKKHENKRISSFSFQNAFFYLTWENDKEVSSLSSSTFDYSTTNWKLLQNVTYLTKTRRLIRIHPHRQRSKYICKPRFIVEVGNHFIWQHMPNWKTLNVAPNLALLHHYRICEFGGNECIKEKSIIDQTAHKYTIPLKDNISNVYYPLINSCHFSEN